MTELNPCPHCGGTEAVAYNPFERLVICSAQHGGCGASGGAGDNTEQGAIEAWNTRYEPTCKRVEGGKKYGSIKWVCSECGYGLGDRRHNYCPNCGRVIEE